MQHAGPRDRDKAPSNAFGGCHRTDKRLKLMGAWIVMDASVDASDAVTRQIGEIDGFVEQRA